MVENPDGDRSGQDNNGDGVGTVGRINLPLFTGQKYDEGGQRQQDEEDRNEQDLIDEEREQPDRVAGIWPTVLVRGLTRPALKRGTQRRSG